jgi:hypothetical protein
VEFFRSLKEEVVGVKVLDEKRVRSSELLLAYETMSYRGNPKTAC